MLCEPFQTFLYLERIEYVHVVRLYFSYNSTLSHGYMFLNCTSGELLENKKKYTAKSEEHPVNVNTNQNSEVHKEREVHGNSGHQRQFKQRPERRRLSHTGILTCLLY